MNQKTELPEAVAALKVNDYYSRIISFIEEERMRFFGDFRQAESSDDVMKIAGSIAALDELLANIS